MEIKVGDFLKKEGALDYGNKAQFEILERNKNTVNVRFYNDVFKKRVSKDVAGNEYIKISKHSFLFALRSLNLSLKKI